MRKTEKREREIRNKRQTKRDRQTERERKEKARKRDKKEKTDRERKEIAKGKLMDTRVTYLIYYFQIRDARFLFLPPKIGEGESLGGGVLPPKMTFS